MSARELSKYPVHLGLGATAEVEPRYAESMDWYKSYAERHAGDGEEGRLVSMHAFTESWSRWEMHPHGSEVVLCTFGSLTLIQEKEDGSAVTTVLTAGEYAINEPGTWHTADVEDEAVALFITAGHGTRIRPR